MATALSYDRISYANLRWSKEHELQITLKCALHGPKPRNLPIILNARCLQACVLLSKMLVGV
jgi:hypothetical protein